MVASIKLTVFIRCAKPLDRIDACVSFIDIPCLMIYLPLNLEHRSKTLNIFGHLKYVGLSAYITHELLYRLRMIPEKGKLNACCEKIFSNFTFSCQNKTFNSSFHFRATDNRHIEITGSFLYSLMTIFIIS